MILEKVVLLCWLYKGMSQLCKPLNSQIKLQTQKSEQVVWEQELKNKNNKKWKQSNRLEKKPNKI